VLRREVIPPAGAGLLALLGWGCAPVETVDAPHQAPVAAASSEPPPTLVIPPAPEVQRRPLPALRHRCHDRRFPVLAGPWVLGCGPGGRVDRAVHVQSGQEVELEDAVESPGYDGTGRVWAPGLEQGLWTLPDPIPRQSGHSDRVAPIAPPALSGPGAAMLLEGRVSRFALAGGPSLSREADPMPWFLPALVWPTVYWVDGRDQASTGLDLWSWGPEGAPQPLVQLPGDQRHVAASEALIAWVDEQGVWLEDRASGARRLHRAEAGFRAGLSVWQEVVCWEERQGEDIDARCSDGLEATGPGDQGWPSRWEDWLLFRQRGVPWLVHAQAPEVAP
jgi:hypothetical protein